MSKDFLQTIISNFDRHRFRRFFSEKNKSFKESQETLANFTDELFPKAQKLGSLEFEDGSLIACAIEIKKELSERSGKKAQYELGKKILKDTQTDAGIFIFYDKAKAFRFSLIYANYQGKKRLWNSFRRFTYFVSPELTNKTFLNRIEEGDFTSLEKIKDAFSVEKVTKEFYQLYRGLYDDLVKDLIENRSFQKEAARNQIDTENFAKKLLGQIVFLYFVQKKGWLGVPEDQKWGSGDKNFLSNQFEEARKLSKNFYNDYLEPLFYDTLNNPRRIMTDPSMSPYFKSKIPFLNGGLFEPEYDWKNSVITLKDGHFEKILEVFDRYNFTVEEESPDDKEVAVDPEMLGKVFENLLPENLRKGKGTYYTPREIVYYMCQESLINFLDTNSGIGRGKAEQLVGFSREPDIKAIAAFEGEAQELDDLLANIKVCDPACGSGAFLVGMLNEIVRLRLLLRLLHPNKLGQKSEYKLKKETIQNCLYGVDIDPGAIEIAKLRLWLSLIVDYELGKIDPLPNLDYRLMTGNSLIEEFEGIKFYNGEDGKSNQATLLAQDKEHEEKTVELKLKIKEYFSLSDDADKKKKRNEINELKDWFIRTSLEKRHQQIATSRKTEQSKAKMLDTKSRKKYLDKWTEKFLSESKIKEVLENLHNPKKTRPFFLWKLEFIDVFEEKNAGFDVVVANPPYMVLSQKELDSFRWTKGTQNTYVAFLEIAERYLNEKGLISFIIPSTWLAGNNFRDFRKEMLDNERIQQIVQLPYDIFEAAYVDNVILVLTGRSIVNPRIKTFKFNIRGALLHDRIVFQHFVSEDWLNAPDSVIFLDKSLLQILKRYQEIPSKLLEEIAKIQRGTLPPRKTEIVKSEGSDNGQNFIRWFSGQVYRYVVVSGPNQYVKYANLKEGKPLEVFQGPRILGRQLVSRQFRLQFAYTKEKFAFKKNIYAIYQISEQFDSSYLLAILNSKLYSYIQVRLNASGQRDDYPAFSLQDFRKFSVPNISSKNQQPFNRLVSNIIEITKDEDYLENSTKQAKVRDSEKQIDRLVYELYGLTEEEIAVVEGKNSNNR